MPSPVPPRSRPSQARRAPGPADPMILGLGGEFRAEKGLREALETLAGSDLARDNIRILVGTPHVERTARELPNLRDTVQFFDTTSPTDYFQFLSTVHVLVLPYPGHNYRYRVSGPIADACSCGTPVLATDLPALRAQVLTPAQGGVCVSEECFASASCLHQALFELRAHWLEYSRGMTANAEARSVDAIASVISRLLLHEEPVAEGARIWGIMPA